MSRILPRHQRFEEHARDIEKIVRIILETEPQQNVTTVQRVTLAGDSRRLRGIPTVARGVAGMSTESADLLRRVENS